jgi:predicted  nucleic acid-binding Zn-ribbon protein
MNRLAGLVAALILAGFGIGVSAQQVSPIQTELLAEVRLLRQSIEALTGTNARVQIVFGRLQLQEQRTATAERRLDDLRNAVSGISMQAQQMGDRIKEMEETSADSRGKPEQLEAMRQELTMARRELGRIEAERARIMADEAEAASALNLEQGRSADLNRQLDELERALAQRPR